MDKDFSRVLESKRLQIEANEIYKESETEALFNRIVSYMSFIGCVVIKRDLWLQAEKERYLGTEFIHVGVIFQGRLPAPALVIAEPHITIRLGNAQWTPRAFEIWMFKWPKLICSLASTPARIRGEYERAQTWSRLRTIITYRAMGAYSLKGYQKWFASDGSSWGWKLMTWLAAIIPAFIANLLLLSYFKIIRGFAVLFTAVMPACIANLSVLSYFRKVKKSALIDIYNLENNENSIMNIVRRKGLKQSHK
jgi:abequosyltransferase